MSNNPLLTQEPVLFINNTPDEEYPLRILQTYRKNCNCFWSTEGLDVSTMQIYEVMNDHQKQRAKLLDNAINILTREKG
jgi:hypothetical protein